MTRLIDADALEKDGWQMSRTVQIDEKTMELQIRKPTDFPIVDAPAVDAVPVRHGKWTADETLYTQGMAVCSCCKAEYYRDDLYMVGNGAQGEPPKYCPNCGARMDKE